MRDRINTVEPDDDTNDKRREEREEGEDKEEDGLRKQAQLKQGITLQLH